MEIVTLKEDAKIALAALMNKSLQVEYTFIMNYPRMIDKLVNYDGINDEKLINDIQRFSKDSLRHFGTLTSLVERLGGKPMWNMEIVARLEDVAELLTQQLEKEKEVLSLFEEMKRFILANKVIIKPPKFFGRFITLRGTWPPENVVDVNEIMSIVEYQIMEERGHIKLVEDSVATIKALKNK